MKKLTAIVSGNVQKVGYRGRVVDIANAFGLKGMVENLRDGRVKIIAEGEDKKLEWFEDAINIKNTLIQVASIEKDYSSVGGEFDDFGKLVFKGETDARLDTAVVHLKALTAAVNNMNDNLGGKMDQMIEGQKGLSGKMDQMIEGQKGLSGKRDQMIEGQEGLNNKMDQMIDKMDKSLSKQDRMLEKQDELLVEVKDMNRSLNDKIDKVLDKDIVELKADVSEMKSALKAKGII
jgi:acylphosphatase